MTPKFQLHEYFVKNYTKLHFFSWNTKYLLNTTLILTSLILSTYKFESIAPFNYAILSNWIFLLLYNFCFKLHTFTKIQYADRSFIHAQTMAELYDPLPLSEVHMCIYANSRPRKLCRCHTCYKIGTLFEIPYFSLYGFLKKNNL